MGELEGKTELRKACLERIDYCLLQDDTFEFTEDALRSDLKCMHPFCEIAYPRTKGEPNHRRRRGWKQGIHSTCQNSMESFAAEMNFSGEVSPMGDFCDKIANLDNMADYPLDDLTIGTSSSHDEGPFM